MERMFSTDNLVMQWITKFACAAYLNVLWLICCLPVVTAGASTTALFYVAERMARDEEGSIARDFFRSFRQNFRQATGIWLILLAAGALLGADGYVLWHLRYTNGFWTICLAVLFAAAGAYAVVLMYIFPLLARFENSTKEMFKNALMIGVRYLFCTVLMAAIYAAFAFLVIAVFTPAFVFAGGVCALLCSVLLRGIFDRCVVAEDIRPRGGIEG